MDLFGAEAVYDEDEGSDDDFAPTPAAEAVPLSPRTNELCLGHEELEAQLLKLFNENRLPHTLIISGVEGIGKSTLGFRLARFLLSQEGDGGGLFGEAAPATTLALSSQNPAFRQVVSGAHPDFLCVERKMDEVKGKKANSLDVEEVRKIVPFLRLSSSNGGWRVVLVDDADTMGRSAQNAILKILEEPPPKTVIILIAHRAGAMIPTIRSRAQNYALKAPTLEVFTAIMRHAGQGALSGQEMESLYTLAEASPGKALRLLEEGGLDLLGRILTTLQSLPKLSPVHLLAEDLARPGADAQFEGFAQNMLWAARTLTSCKARGAALPLVLQNSFLQNLMEAKDLAWFSELAETLEEHFGKVLGANLERREAVLRCFLLWGA